MKIGTCQGISLFFWLSVFCGTIIVIPSFWSLVKILCNFGTTGEDKRQKYKDKSKRLLRRVAPRNDG